MQIPYELEFVEGRPTVSARAIPMPEPFPVWPDARAHASHDVFDRLLLWAFRVIRRFETR